MNKMENNKFDGVYEYMGFVIYNGDSKHIWDIEPIGWGTKAIDNFKSQSESFKTLAEAKKWIKKNGDTIKETMYI